MKSLKIILISVASASALILGVAACGSSGVDGSSSPGDSAASSEAQAQGQDSSNLINNQPVPVYKWSQMRQTLINVQDIQANGENTTTFFFNMGVQDPINSCTSIGMPVPSTAQLTNPFQAQWNSGSYNNGYAVAGVPVGQMDPPGVYTGDSTGTNVLCIDPQGRQYIQYWEGFVDSVSGPAVWDASKHQVRLLGAPIPLKTKENSPAPVTAVPSPSASK